MRPTRILFTTLTAALLMMPAQVEAQAASADITATATVAAVLSASLQSNLQFGNVFRGFAKTVLTDDAAAGAVQIAGAAGAEVDIDVGNPTTLVGPDPLDPLALSLTAEWSLTNSPLVGTAFTPGTTLTQNLSGTGDFYIFVGGTVTPTGTQTPGAYSQTINVTATYTGN